jgi:hypothetical protein
MSQSFILRWELRNLWQNIQGNFWAAQYYIYLFIYLFIVYLTTLFSVADYLASNERVISGWWIGKDLEGSGRGLILRYHNGIRLKDLRKATQNLSLYSPSPCSDLDTGPPEYEVEYNRIYLKGLGKLMLESSQLKFIQIFRAV